MNIEFTKDELLLLLDNVDFCQDNRESYDEYSIIDVKTSINDLREKIYQVYTKNEIKIQKAQAKQPTMEWEDDNYLDSLSEGYDTKVDALVDSMGVTDKEVSTVHTRKDMDLL